MAAKPGVTGNVAFFSTAVPNLFVPGTGFMEESFFLRMVGGMV